MKMLELRLVVIKQAMHLFDFAIGIEWDKILLVLIANTESHGDVVLF